ncbi:MAG: glucosaminidase domain-containing protein, partial [Saprospiraceae bacterium]|nr:glucosaminidase domain-containing protein [Saprospiraceae bacterium]
MQACSSVKKSSKTQTSSAPSALSSRSGGDRNQVYADRFGSSAILEMERDGIPASITLAQGILESGAGTSELAQNANNHFGIKCGTGWNGKTYQKKDDDRDANGNLIESCFRKYDKVEDSFHDHGEFLR